MKLLKEFKDFAMKGNVLDLAVAVVIGGAFGKIVASLVDDIIMPIVGVIIGGVDFTSLSVQVGEATVAYGNFIQQVVNFLIIAFSIFMVVKSMNAFKKKEEAAPAAPPAPSNEEVLLTEIRDLLKNK
ncbi:large-conductance mechanosensitive channel protein MscL [Filifactor villosus]|uniref:Large-conductance mechanosensitive channel n=1 Tax=Filifactor villosus TaxID=29374 RepID=A0ABV9QKT7_9FIRM